MERWSIWIDIEGFCCMFKKEPVRALSALSELARSLLLIGTRVYPESPQRLFVHQFGDAFIIVSDFPEPTADRPLAIAIALMRHLLSKNISTKCAISTGDLGDYLGCYPRELRDVLDAGRCPLGEGVMTIFPVTGNALINAYSLHGQRHGAVLLLDTIFDRDIPAGVKVVHDAPTTIDWIHSDYALAREVCDKAGLTSLDSDMALDCLKSYISRNALSEQWRKSTLESVGLSFSVFSDC